jgi:hypothetical protein
LFWLTGLAGGGQDSHGQQYPEGSGGRVGDRVWGMEAGGSGLRRRSLRVVLVTADITTNTDSSTVAFTAAVVGGAAIRPMRQSVAPGGVLNRRSRSLGQDLIWAGKDPWRGAGAADGNWVNEPLVLSVLVVAGVPQRGHVRE